MHISELPCRVLSSFAAFFHFTTDFGRLFYDFLIEFYIIYAHICMFYCIPFTLRVKILHFPCAIIFRDEASQISFYQLLT